MFLESSLGAPSLSQSQALQAGFPLRSGRLQFPATLHTTYSRGELEPPPLGLPRDNLLLVLFDGERRHREVVKLLHLD